jgi:DGQHR domain-containing protein
MKFIVLRGTNLNTEMYRGFAPIADIAKVSAPDSFNQDTNPNGLQRDLSETHARDAYRYVEGAVKVADHNRAWSEVLLNVRDPSVVKITPLDEALGLYEIEILEERINKSLPRPQISRTDGNHRLNYGEGDPKYNWPPLTSSTPFALTVDLSPEVEAFLFMDINDNQKTMNTAHLAHLRARLTGPEKLALEDPALWIAERLTDDPKSPWHGIVHKGGQRTQGLKRRANLAALRTGIEMTLSEAVKLRSVSPIESKYALIRMYWNAVAKIYSWEWADPQSMVLKGIGLWIFSQLGAEVIDRCLVRGISPAKLEDEMGEYLRQTKLVFDWKTGADIRGYTGRGGARDASNKMKAALSDEDVSISQIAAAMQNLV